MRKPNVSNRKVTFQLETFVFCNFLLQENLSFKKMLYNEGLILIDVV